LISGGRYTYPDKRNISLVGTLFQFLWHFCSITARVLALSLFASVFPKWIGKRRSRVRDG
jgi:hypothetical protein